MTEPKQFKRGKRTYTRWGPSFKEVRVEGPSKEAVPLATATSVSFDVDPQTEIGVYSNVTTVHRSDEEVILDFAFLSPGQARGRVRSRVVIPLSHVQRLSTLLSKTADDMNKHENGRD